MFWLDYQDIICLIVIYQEFDQVIINFYQPEIYVEVVFHLMFFLKRNDPITIIYKFYVIVVDLSCLLTVF